MVFVGYVFLIFESHRENKATSPSFNRFVYPRANPPWVFSCIDISDKICYSKATVKGNAMLDKIKSFFVDEDKIDNAIWWVGYVVVGWLLYLLGWLAKKTKTQADDELVEKAKEKVKQAKKKKTK